MAPRSRRPATLKTTANPNEALSQSDQLPSLFDAGATTEGAQPSADFAVPGYLPPQDKMAFHAVDRKIVYQIKACLEDENRFTAWSNLAWGGALGVVLTWTADLKTFSYATGFMFVLLLLVGFAFYSQLQKIRERDNNLMDDL